MGEGEGVERVGEEGGGPRIAWLSVQKRLKSKKERAAVMWRIQREVR